MCNLLKNLFSPKIICWLLWCFADLWSFRGWKATYWQRWDRTSTFLTEVSQGVRQAWCRTACTSENKNKLTELVLVLYCCITMNNLELAVTGLRPLISQLRFPGCGVHQTMPQHPWHEVLNYKQLCKVESSLAAMEVKSPDIQSVSHLTAAPWGATDADHRTLLILTSA